MYLPRDLISHLYTNLIRSHHAHSPTVLLLVALEPDSLCACRILTALLRRDFIQHKIQPVSGYADLAKAGEELVRPMKTTEGGSGGLVICLGVGGLVDLGTVLGLEDEESDETMCGVEVWVLDARRPYNLDNVFGGMPIEAPLGDVGNEVRPRARGVDKGCIQKSYRPGTGGIIVFDDGDILNDLETEKNAYCALAEMPELDADESDDEDDEPDTQDSSQSRKRKSWSDRDNDEDNDEDEERPRQRRRSNSGSSITSRRSRSRTPSSSQPTSPSSKPQSPKPRTAKQLRKRLRELREKHETILRQYNSIGTSYSEPVSTLAYSLAAELGREDNNTLWLAIIGVTSLELSGHTSTGLGTSVSRKSHLSNEHHRGWRMTRSSQTYALLRDEVRRLNPPADQSPTISPATSTNSPSDTSIRLTPDPRFLLLRHWSLYDSMLHSPYLSSRLHAWNESGIKRLHKLLAKMGVSLTQCKQTYTHMDMDLKKSLRDRLLKYAAVYGLDDLVPSGSGTASYDQEGWGFIRSWGWKAQLSAVDVGVILGAILDVGSQNAVLLNNAHSHSQSQSSQPTTHQEDIPDRSTLLLPRFFAAYDALTPSSPSKLLDAIPAAQHLLRAILRTGSSLLQKHQIRHLRAFRMGVVKEGPDLGLFSGSPSALVKLALWVGEAISVQEKEKSRSGEGVLTPLVLAALDEARGTYVVVGTGGGIGGGEDIEGRKEREERRKKKEEDRERKRKIKEEKKQARRAQRELLGEDSDNDDEDDETESESEAESEESDDEIDEAEREKRRKRGFGHNRFGIAFQEVVEETNARVRIDSFDHCIVEVKKEDLAGFLEGLSLKAVVGR